MRRILAVFTTDPMRVYHQKGEIKLRYLNPGDLFDEIHVLTRADTDIEAGPVQGMAGRARLFIHPIGALRPLSWQGNPVSPAYRARVVKLLADIRPDVIRAYDPVLSGLLAVSAGRDLGIPTVVSVHTNFSEFRHLFIQARDWPRIGYYYGLTPFLERYSLRKADRVICVYEFGAMYARNMGRKDPDVIYNRVYPERFADARPALQLDKPIILSVGILTPPKNQEVLIRAMPGLDAYLVLIGQGPTRQHLEQLAYQLGVSEQVIFIDRVANAEIKDYYAAAAVYATGMHHGGISIPILEAMAAGLPLVVNRQRVVPEPELVHDIAEVVPNTPAGFHAGLKKVLADPALAGRMAEASRRRMAEVDGNVMEARERDLYVSLLKKRGRA